MREGKAIASGGCLLGGEVQIDFCSHNRVGKFCFHWQNPPEFSGSSTGPNINIYYQSGMVQ